MNKLWLTINVTARAMVSLVGVALFIIADEFYVGNVVLIRTAAVVFILFGVYRVVTFYGNYQSYRRESEREER